MFSKTWLVVKDDKKLTYEVVSQVTNENFFTNKVIAMQREGMQVTSVLIPASNRQASKESIKFIGYSREEGLYERLLREHNAILLRKAGEWDD